MTDSGAQRERISSLLDDLHAETEALAAVCRRLDVEALSLPTPAEPWTVHDQLAHLEGFDAAAIRALTDPEAFRSEVAVGREAGVDPVDEVYEAGRAMSPLTLVSTMLDRRAELIDAAEALDPSMRVEWYGPPMSLMSFLSARLMETWAHGQDIRDALGYGPEISARLRHIAHLGIGARAYSYRIHRLDGADVPVSVVLIAPDGDAWTWGDPSAENRVRGNAIDFCLAVTQRRHLSDVDLEVRGEHATRWLSIAQAFAGPPGTGRAPTADR